MQDHLASITDAEGTVTTYQTGDRDLLTQETSLVSSTTLHAYDDHGELVESMDARGILTVRTPDAFDRVTLVDYPGTDLDVTYTYDDPLVPFSKGRLPAITRSGASVDYTFDRFGRVLQDGALTFGDDSNGNRSSIEYPGGVVATYTHDFADRELSLIVSRPGQPDQAVASAAAYEPSGPLRALALGNGTTETRTYTTRYFPQRIELTGPAILQQITLGVGGTRDYVHGPAGHLELVTAGANQVDFITDAAGRLARLERARRVSTCGFRDSGRTRRGGLRVLARTCPINLHRWYETDTGRYISGGSGGR